MARPGKLPPFLEQEARYRDVVFNPSEFKLAKKLGFGSFGRTNCYQTSDGGHYCLKMIVQFFANKIPKKKMFLDEVSKISKIRHPSVVPLINVLFPSPQFPAHLTFITPFIPGDSVRSMGARSWDDTSRMMTAFGVAAGMQYLHSMGICHSCLSSMNIILDAKSEPRITDFWYTKFISHDCYQSIVAEKEIWAAPEIVAGRKFTNKVDVFAYGMILYEVATHILVPFPGAIDHGQVAEKILSGQRPIIPDSVAPRVMRLIERCWAHDPRERPTFDAIVADFYTSGDPIWPECDVQEFNAYRDKVMFDFLQERSNVQLFRFGDVPDKHEDVLPFIKERVRVDKDPRAMYMIWQMTGDDKMLKSAAEAGHKKAQYHYALLHDDDTERMTYMKKAAEQGNVNALAVYSRKTGDLSWLRKAAELGSVEANFDLFTKTREIGYAIAAAYGGHAKSWYTLAVMHETGQLCAIDADSEIFARLDRTHEENVAAFQSLLRKEVCKDLNMALHRYQDADDNSDADAARKLDRIRRIGTKFASKASQVFKQNKDPERSSELMMYAIDMVSSSRRDDDSTEAMRIFKAAAALQNSVDAYYQIYLVIVKLGSNDDLDKETAYDYLKRAAELGHPSAMLAYAHVLSWTYEQRGKSEASKGKAIHYYRQAALFGDPDVIASYTAFLGQVDHGELVDAEIAACTRIAADRGRLESQAQYAKMAAEGRGMPKDVVTAAKYYKLGVRRDLPDCMVSLALLYENEKSLGAGQDKILKLYLTAGVHGNVKALMKARQMFREGHGACASEKRAVMCCKLAALLGDARARLEYATALLKGNGVAEDPREAVRFYELASEAGSLEASMIAGSIYENGPSENAERADMFYSYGAGTGDAEAQYRYASFLFKRRKIGKAIEYFKKAEAQDHIKSMMELAILYERGQEGVSRDLGRARKLRARVSALLRPSATEALDARSLMGHTSWSEDSCETGVVDQVKPMMATFMGADKSDEDCETALAALLSLAKEGNAHACREIGKLYLYGTGVEQHLVLAQKFLTSAAETGDRDALFELGNAYVAAGQKSAAARTYQLANLRGHPDASIWRSILLFQGEEAVIHLIKNPTAEIEPPLDEGHLLGDGRVLSRDLDPMYIYRLLFFYRQEAENGNKYAQHNYGKLRVDTGGNRTAEEEGIQWIKRAADQGLLLSEYWYAQSCLARNENIEDALGRLEKGAQLNNSLCLVALTHYYEGKGEFDKAMSYAERGEEDPTCLFTAARLMLRRGDADQEKVISLLQRAAASDWVAAMLLLGSIYMTCKPRRSEEAAVMFMKAADKGSSGGHYFYAWCLDNGCGVDVDKEAAIRQYAASGDTRRCDDDGTIFTEYVKRAICAQAV